MTQDPDDLALEAFVDQQDGAERAKTLAYLQGNADARADVEQLRTLNDLVRKVELQTVAPRSLVDRLRQESVARHAWRPQLNRRTLLTGGATVAACLGGIIAIRSQQSGQHDLKTTLFGDFRTLVAADRQLDFETTDMAELVNWFTPRVPFDVPKLSAPDVLQTQGGRLCWLAGRRFAAIDFDTSAGTACLYICRSEDLRVDAATPIPAEDDDLIIASEAGVNGAFWQQSGIMLSLIGNPSAAEITNVADQVRHGMRQRTST